MSDAGKSVLWNFEKESDIWQIHKPIPTKL